MEKNKHNEIIADNILRLRQEHQLSQDELAASLQSMGLNYTRGRISMIEAKKRPVPAVLLAGLKLVFNCEYSVFLQSLKMNGSRFCGFTGVEGNVWRYIGVFGSCGRTGT